MTDGDAPLPMQEDTSLPLFQPPDGAASGLRIGAATPDLVVVAAAGPRPFLLEGSAAVVGGVESKEPCEIRFPASPLAATVARDDGVVANTMVSPGRLRRERVGRGPSVVETVMAAPELPLVLFDWSAGGAQGSGVGPGDAPIEMLIRAEAARPGGDPSPRGGALRYHAGMWAVTFALEPVGREGPAAPPADLLIVALAGAATPPAWTFEATSGGAVRFSTGPTDATTLLIASGQPDTIRTALRASSHAAVHERRAVAPGRHGSVGLRSGVSEVDDGFAWAATRLGFGIRRTRIGYGAAGPPSVLWCGLAAAALGDDEGAARCVRALLDAGEDDGAALLAGRLALSTGRVREALACAQRVLGAPAGAGGETAGPGGPTGLSVEAATALADGLRYAMADEDLARLRASATATATSRPDDARTSGGRKLPTLGDGSAARSGRADATGGSDPRARPAGPSSHTAEARRAWAMFANDPDAGWVAWRNLISAGMSGSIHGAGAWDDPAGYDPPATAAFLIVGLLHGMLGAAPDAPVGRLRLAPRFPAHLTSFGVGGLPVGEARVDLAYSGTPDRHRFVITPTQGRVPPLLIFEPEVPGAVREVRIDGAVADVDRTQVGPRTLFRLQTPLDAGRTIDAIREP